jgi:hypothetical protein
VKVNHDIPEGEHVPMNLWGRDHWSTLAYIETKLVNHGETVVEFDPRMRQKRRHFRLLLQALPGHRKPGAIVQGQAMEAQHGSRLSDGSYLPWHDDWDCVTDMIEEGLFENDGGDGELIGYPLKLTELGYAATAAIRKHKAEGGNFSNCGEAVATALEALA